MSFWGDEEAKVLFEKLPFYNTFIEKPRIKPRISSIRS